MAIYDSEKVDGILYILSRYFVDIIISVDDAGSMSLIMLSSCLEDNLLQFSF